MAYFVKAREHTGFYEYEVCPLTPPRKHIECQSKHQTYRFAKRVVRQSTGVDPEVYIERQWSDADSRREIEALEKLRLPRPSTGTQLESEGETL